MSKNAPEADARSRKKADGASKADDAATTAQGRLNLPVIALVLGAVALLFAVLPILSFLAWIPAGAAVVAAVLVMRRTPAARRKAWTAIGLSAAGWVVALVVSVASIGTALGGAPATTPAPQAISTPSATPTKKPVPKPKPTQTPAAEDVAPLDPDVPESSQLEPAVAVADSSATAGTAQALLATLPVKGRAPKTGYDRAGQFGTAWLDVDRNGCDTRNDILQRDLTATSLSGPCKVMSGTLVGPYTGKTINFVRGNVTSMAVQIDHVVALMNAWETGAQQLTQAQRVAFANDPINLLAVDGPTNSRKGAGDAATWLPPSTSFRCEYVARQISVKATYGLWVTAAERDAMMRILGGCPDQPAYTSSFTPAAAPVVVAPVPAPPAPPAPAPVAPAPGPAPAPAPAPPAPSNVYFKNCTEARNAGAAPVRVGSPGYGKHLDRDGDGVGCE